MKGLLLKDTYMFSKLCKAFILIDIVFIVVSFWGEGNMFFVLYPCIISGMLPMTLISYDEREKWDKYSGTLPYTRAQLVSSKYLIGLFGNIIVFVLIAVVQAFRMAKGGTFVLEEYLTVITLLLSVSLIAPTILYPIVFKFGAEKGRIFYYIIIGSACAVSTVFINTDIGLFSEKLNNFLSIAIILAVIVLLYTASWLLSIQFYKKREF